jgi:hypothetical protein
MAGAIRLETTGLCLKMPKLYLVALVSALRFFRNPRMKLTPYMAIRSDGSAAFRRPENPLMISLSFGMLLNEFHGSSTRD